MKQDCDVEHTVEQSGLDRKNEEEREEKKDGAATGSNSS